MIFIITYIKYLGGVGRIYNMPRIYNLILYRIYNPFLNSP